MNNQILMLREQIDTLDLNLLSILAKRRALTLNIGNYKINHQYPVRDKIREHILLEKLIIAGQKLKLNKSFVNNIFKIIIEDSVLEQQKLLKIKKKYYKTNNSIKIAFLGPKGSYSHLAATQYGTRNNFNKIIEHECYDFLDVVKSVENEKAEYGILPIENSSSGAISEVYNLLQQTNLSLIDEIFIFVNHCILVTNNSQFDQIETIYTHQQPFQQCSQFLTCFPQWKVKYFSSTAEAIKKVAKLNTPTIAALGNGMSGIFYGLKILQYNIANQQHNITRFIILTNKSINIANMISNNTNIMLSISTEQSSNILIKILLVLYSNRITITRLKSELIKNEIDKNTFYFDIQANLYDTKTQKILQELKNIASSLKILGYYSNKNIILQL